MCLCTMLQGPHPNVGLCIVLEDNYFLGGATLERTYTDRGHGGPSNLFA
jgi:hypothetical protein